MNSDTGELYKKLSHVNSNLKWTILTITLHENLHVCSCTQLKNVLNKSCRGK
jgi:hypothetical protein